MKQNDEVIESGHNSSIFLTKLKIINLKFYSNLFNSRFHKSFLLPSVLQSKFHTDDSTYKFN